MGDKISSKLIYVMDDDQEILVYLKKILLNFDLEVETFHQSEMFLRRLKERMPDLCFVDLNLGVHDGAGFQLIKAIRKILSKSVILIVLSSRDASEDITYALEVGCSDYVTKPIKASIIESKIFQHLTHENNLPDSTTKIPEEFSECTFDLGFFPYHISEKGFVILTQHFVPKATLINFNSGILFDIMQTPFSLRVENNWVHNDTGYYALSFTLPVDDVKYKAAFRNWMLTRKPY